MEETADETSDVKVETDGIFAVVIETSGSPIYMAPISNPSLKPPSGQLKKCDEVIPEP